MKKIKHLFSALLLLATFSIQAQVGIGTTSPAASAQLDVTSTAKGFLPPRMTILQRDAIPGPVGGLMIWCTDCIPSGGLSVYTGTEWVIMARTLVVPTVVTTPISGITSTTAVSGGNVSSDGGSPVTARGVCWSTTPNPTVALSTKTSNGIGRGTFVSNITGLTLGTIYYVRAYATNAVGTSYGAEFSFTSALLDIGSSYQGGIVAYILQPGDPGFIPSQTKGLIAAPSDFSSNYLWSTFIVSITTFTELGTGNTNTNNMASATIGAGSACFELVLNGYSDWFLPSKDELNKLYINRVAIGGFSPDNYWSSSQGDETRAWNQYFANGSQITNPKNLSGSEFRVRAIRAFTIIPTPSVITTAVSSITNTSAVSGGDVISEGFYPVTVRGVCWDIATNPTVALSTKTTNGAGPGSFVSNITGLTTGITYYLRAYATNTAGTSYGAEFSFNTGIPVPPTVITTAITGITSTSALSGGNVTSEGYSAVTVRGVCWNNATNPTVALSTKTTNGAGPGSFVSNITGLVSGITYYVRAYATNAIGTSYGAEFTFTTMPSIGESYQGGIIAYILQPGDPGYIAGQTHGLIAAASDQSTGAEWGCYGTTISGADGTALGTGNQNTIDIMAGCSTAGIAARLCGDLILNGYIDWYLPSKDELNKLYVNRVAVGGFTGDNYWTSSELDNGYSRNQYFANGNQPFNLKSLTFRVRAVRAF